jgi:hypothetical protein
VDPGGPVLDFPAPSRSGRADRIDDLEVEVASLRDELAALRSAFEAFRSQL